MLNEIELVKRDICFLYHQLAGYHDVMGDLDYRYFTLPYWQYFNPAAVSDDRTEESLFVSDGCLVMVFAMACDSLDGSGRFLVDDKERLSAVQDRLKALAPSDAKTDRLVAAVRQATSAVASNHLSPHSNADAAIADGCWIHETFINAYFINNRR